MVINIAKADTTTTPTRTPWRLEIVISVSLLTVIVTPQRRQAGSSARSALSFHEMTPLPGPPMAHGGPATGACGLPEFGMLRSHRRHAHGGRPLHLNSTEGSRQRQWPPARRPSWRPSLTI